MWTSETLHQLNPALLRLATPNDPSFELHLPKGTAENFPRASRTFRPKKWVSWRRHKVRPGDTLTSIAKKYRVTPAAIASANNLEKGEALSAGDKRLFRRRNPRAKRRAGWCNIACAKGIRFWASRTATASARTICASGII